MYYVNRLIHWYFSIIVNLSYIWSFSNGLMLRNSSHHLWECIQVGHQYLSVLNHTDLLLMCFCFFPSYLFLLGKWRLCRLDHNGLPSSSQKKTQHGVIQISQKLQTPPFAVKVTLQGQKTLVFSNSTQTVLNMPEEFRPWYEICLSIYTHEMYQLNVWEENYPNIWGDWGCVVLLGSDEVQI